jgi:PadR family transcriptional regulator PadR
MRRTQPLLKVIATLLEDPAVQHWGYDLSRRTGIRSGVLYPILRRMLEEGWLKDGWEEQRINGTHRPPRRYYELTGEGQRTMAAVLAEYEAEHRPSRLLGQGA